MEPTATTTSRRHYRAPGASVRTVRLCDDAHNRSRGKRTGGVKLWAYGYRHLAALLGLTEDEIRKAVKDGELNPQLLASIVAFAVKDFKRLGKIVAAATNPKKRKPKTA